MADNSTRELHNVIEIDDHDYFINAKKAETATIAETANKLAKSLTIKIGSETVKFDGSTEETVEVSGTGSGGTGGTASVAEAIQVTMDNGKKNAKITISANDPKAEDGSTGDIWFKY